MEIVTEFIKDGRTVATGKGSNVEISIPDAQLWDAEHPNLYDVRVMLVEDGDAIDETWERTGIRTLAWNAAKGFLVNGKSVKLRGGCVHHDHGPLGACSFKKAEYRRIRIMKEAGFNAVRYSHNPANKAFLDACYELGMYVMNETFDTWRTPKSPYDYSLHFDSEWEKDVTSMVMKSLNPPSVIMYSIGNEIMDLVLLIGSETSQKLAGLCKQLDPTRPTTNAINMVLAGMGTSAFPKEKGVITADDVVDPCREEKDSKAAGSLYVNMVVTLVPFLTKLFAGSKKVNSRIKGSFEAIDIVGYNYAEEAYKRHHAWHPDRVMVGTESFPSPVG